MGAGFFLPAMHIDTLIHARWLLPVVPDTVLEHHSLAVQNGKIIDLLPSEQASSRYTATTTVNCDQHAVLPGLINAHTHAAMNLLKGLADDLPLMTWLNEHIWPAEQQWLSEQFVHDGTRLAIAEMLRSGTTTFNDMYLYPEVAANCVRHTGIRAVIGLIVIDFPTPWARDADEYLSKGLALFDELKAETRITAAFAPHAPYTVADAPLRRVATLAHELSLPVHIHLHETAHEVASAEQQNGQRPIERLRELGLLNRNLLAVHMTQLNDDDINIAADHRINVVHCPESNLKLASGICPTAALIEAGINVTLGTDSSASNNDLDMFSEMRTAALLGKGFSDNAAALPAAKVLEMATINGARALGLENRIGSLEKGKWADVIAVDLAQVETQPVYDPRSALVYSAARHHVEHVWVAGKALLTRRQLTTLDSDELLTRAAGWRDKILAQSPQSKGVSG